MWTHTFLFLRLELVNKPRCSHVLKEETLHLHHLLRRVGVLAVVLRHVDFYLSQIMMRMKCFYIM